MKPVNFDEQNFIFKPPAGMTEKECGLLPCYVDNVNGVTISCWELSDEEIEQLKETKQIWLSMNAFPVPPVSLTTKCPISRVTLTVKDDKSLKKLNDNLKPGSKKE